MAASMIDRSARPHWLDATPSALAVENGVAAWFMNRAAAVGRAGLILIWPIKVSNNKSFLQRQNVSWGAVQPLRSCWMKGRARTHTQLAVLISYKKKIIKNQSYLLYFLFWRSHFISFFIVYDFQCLFSALRLARTFYGLCRSQSNSVFNPLLPAGAKKKKKEKYWLEICFFPPPAASTGLIHRRDECGCWAQSSTRGYWYTHTQTHSQAGSFNLLF